jgi:predicted DNA-binding protein YlxM (UPF0122 family)
MEDRERLILLFDYYENLLTDAQKSYFKDYYFDNLSLAEVSENNDVSRNAVSKDLKLTVEKLNSYEEKLGLMKKDKNLRKLVDKISDTNLKEEIIKLLDE